MATRKRRAELANAVEDGSEIDFSGTPVPLDADEHLLQIPGCQRFLISLTGKGFERALLAKLDWFTYMYVSSHCVESFYISCVYALTDENRKVLAWAMTGYRSDAVRLIGEQVMQPRGLIGLAQDTLHASTAEIRAVFEVLARNDANFLVHCTQGKDRAGLIVLMILLLAGETVPAAAIADDYMRSELELLSEFEERMREVRALGLGEDYTRCPPGFVEAVTQYLQDRYGGVKGYLAGIGVDEEMQGHIRHKLLIR